MTLYLTNRTKSSQDDSRCYTLSMNGRLSFGEWLEDQIRGKGWNQTVFGEAVGVARQTVSNWVNNVQPPRRRATRDIARVLGVDQNEVLVRAGYPPLDPDYVLPDDRQGAEESQSVDLADPRVLFFASHARELSEEEWAVIRTLLEKFSKD